MQYMFTIIVFVMLHFFAIFKSPVQQTFECYFTRRVAIFCEAFPVADADDWVSMSPRHRPFTKITGVGVASVGHLGLKPKLHKGIRAPSSV